MSFWSDFNRGWRRLENAPKVCTVKRHARQIVGRELRHFTEVRRRKVHIGGWTFSESDIAESGIVWSFGIGEDLTFELALVERFGMEVHAFDPTPRALAWVKRQRAPEGLHIHSIGVAAHDGTAEFAPSISGGNPSFRAAHLTAAGPTVSCEMRRLSTLAGMLGHTKIELLKLDIEGLEYEVIDELIESRCVEVRQLLVEFHHRFKRIGRQKTADVVDKLHDAGYRIFHISPTGREYSFIREMSRAAD